MGWSHKTSINNNSNHTHKCLFVELVTNLQGPWSWIFQTVLRMNFLHRIRSLRQSPVVRWDPTSLCLYLSSFLVVTSWAGYLEQKTEQVIKMNMFICQSSKIYIIRTISKWLSWLMIYEEVFIDWLQLLKKFSKPDVIKVYIFLVRQIFHFLKQIIVFFI